MKRVLNKMYIVLGLMATLTYTSCDSFLDKQEDEALTFDQIWETRENTEKYWRNAMSFLPDDQADWSYAPWHVATDEAIVAYDRDSERINKASWNPSNVPYYQMGNYYKGIRECNIFLQNLNRCSDPKATPMMRDMWRTQTLFARAYFYFMMMRVYGPVFLIGDEIIDATGTTESFYRPRNTWEECVNYVISEMESLSNESAITDGWLSDSEKGLATKGACQAVIARLKLYHARDLFNGNKLYASVQNPDGANLFPVQYDANKWLDAAKAARVLIDNPLYKLHRGEKGDPYEDYFDVLWKPWNDELIWTTGYSGGSNMGVHVAPSGIGGTAYGGCAVTQQQVDAYAMKDGRYPITGYDEGEPIIDPSSGYTEKGLSAWTYPTWLGTTVPNGTKMPNMFKDREPRFYVTVFFSGTEWKFGVKSDEKKMISFAKGGNSNISHDRTRSGYMMNRFYDHRSNSTTGKWGNCTFPTFRLGEMYLNFIEAVLECKKRGVAMPADYESKAMDAWADLRSRVGMVPITEVYPNASTEELIDLYRRERRLELAYENHRYFDTRTWMISKKVDNGSIYGMNIEFPGSGTTTPEGFWKRTVVDTRIFKDNFYLYPFSQREVERNKMLVQNYGW